MSRTLDDAGDETAGDAGRTGVDLNAMLYQGRSFSGRERNCCFLNVRHGRFANISAVSGIDFPDDGRGLAVVDWDHDGDLDLWITNRNAPRLRFLRNDSVTAGHFLSVLLRGNGKTVNRDAIGARVDLVMSDQKGGRQIKTLRAGEGFLSQSSKWMHFGLGRAESVKRLVVHWPGGGSDEYANLEADRRYVLVQGVEQPELWRAPAGKLVLHASPQEVSPQSGAARVSLIAAMPMLQMTYKQFDGADRLLRTDDDRPVLLNLWASWCAPCLAELKELAEREAEIRDAGIEVVALCVDGIGEDSSSPAAAEDYLRRSGIAFRAGRATPEILQNLQSIHNRVIPAHRPLPLPTSWLIDRSGKLSVIYRGRIEVSELIEDAKRTSGTRWERRLRAALIPGRLIDHPRVVRSAEKSDLRILLPLAGDLQQAGRLHDSARFYRAVLKLRPDMSEPRNNYGAVLAALGDLPAAQKQFESAIRIDPDSAQAHFNLGNVLERQNQLAAATTEYETAVRNQPDHVDALYNLGNVYARQSLWHKAAIQFRIVLRLQPNHGAARKNLEYMTSQPERLK